MDWKEEQDLFTKSDRLSLDYESLDTTHPDETAPLQGIMIEAHSFS